MPRPSTERALLRCVAAATVRGQGRDWITAVRAVQVVLVLRVSQVQRPITASPAEPSAGVAGSLYVWKTRIASAHVGRPFTTTTRARAPVTVVILPQAVPGRAGRVPAAEEGDGGGMAKDREG